MLDVLHRSGNVHASNGANAFVRQCIDTLRRQAPSHLVETRMDSAFFNETIIDSLASLGVEFSVSVPFECLTELKAMIEGRKRWRCYNSESSYFETDWKPKSSGRCYRFVFIRQGVAEQRKKPVQLDLFEPQAYSYEVKVIVTNKIVNVKKVLAFHNGRGSQENIFRRT